MPHQASTPNPQDDPDTRRRDLAAALDGALHAAVAPLTGGLSPISLLLAQADWALHLATQPAQSLRLAMDAQRSLLDVCTGNPGSTQPPPGQSSEDLRFSHPGWQQWPYASWVQAYRAAEVWWKDATALRGMTAHHQELARVFARQWLDTLSPANFVLSNPEVLQRSAERWGGNFIDGAAIAMDEWRLRKGLPPLQPAEHAYQPGVDLAVTPGKVVHRNALVELIQYARADAQGARRAGVHRAVVDHEVLRARPVAVQLDGALAGRAGPHGVHRLVAQPRRGRCAAGHGRLPAAGRVRPAGRHRPAAAAHARACLRLLPGRHLAGHRRGGAGAAATHRAGRAAGAAGQPVAAGRRDRLQRARRDGRADRRIAGGDARGPDGRTRLPYRAADGRQLPVPAFARAGVVGADTRAAARRAAAPQRPDGLERRRHAHAGRHAQRVPAPLLPAQRAGRGAVPGGGQAGVAGRHPPGRSSRWAPRRTMSRPGARSTSCTG